MRLFVGIVPPPEAISHAAGAVDWIASTTPEVRWIPSERWHLTLAFLGEVDSDFVTELTIALDEVATSPIRGLLLAGSGTFPGVVWLGVGGGAAESRLGSLADAVRRAMRRAGIGLEPHLWQPHVTVGRWRPSPRREKAARGAARSLADYADPEFDVDEIRLVHSVTGPTPTYTDIHVSRLVD